MFRYCTSFFSQVYDLLSEAHWIKNLLTKFHSSIFLQGLLKLKVFVGDKVNEFQHPSHNIFQLQ